MLTRASLTIRLHPNDDVVIARTQLVGGTLLADENVTVSGLVPPGHKVATHAIRAGEPVKRYNQIIGFASRNIGAGEHVHLNNLAMGSFDRDYAFGVDVKPTRYVDPPATFSSSSFVPPTSCWRAMTTSSAGCSLIVNEERVSMTFPQVRDVTVAFDTALRSIAAWSHSIPSPVTDGGNA